MSNLLPLLAVPPETVEPWSDGGLWRRFSVDGQEHLFVVGGSQIYQIDAATARRLDDVEGTTADELSAVLQDLGIDADRWAIGDPPTEPLVRTLSLAVSQKCNLACAYCYAEGGSFGGPPRHMSNAVAQQAVERLFAESARGDRVHLSFLGGEPLLNRPVLRRAALAARRRSEELGVELDLSITTNGTLLDEDDAAFFDEQRFAVTISVDGAGAAHDATRPFKNGRGSYRTVLKKVAPLLRRQKSMQVSARVTVTPRNLQIVETLEHFLSFGFHSVGFSPLLAAPTGREEMDAAALDQMLAQMIACGQRFETSVMAGRRYAFANMVNAMREIHQGTHRPYPCGAGVGYFGVSAAGRLFACHRFVDDSAGAMGDLDGVDRERQTNWLAQRHVERQHPCQSCWARYLCGGGCHHEVIARGRNACNFIRGWLHYCLQAYARLRRQRPDYFGVTAGVDECEGAS